MSKNNEPRSRARPRGENIFIIVIKDSSHSSILSNDIISNFVDIIPKRLLIGLEVAVCQMPVAYVIL